MKLSLKTKGTQALLTAIGLQTLLTAILLIVPIVAKSGNRIYSPTVKSLTAIVGDDWQNRPVMALGGGEVLHIGFDELSHNYHRYVYRLEHCEADWRPSEELFESEWLEGFNGNPIDDYQNSINTTTLYTHYQLTIPNDRCRLKMSGNYRLTVYDEDEGDERVLEVEFYVVEQLMDIGMSVTTNTDIDVNQSHQQVGMTVNFNQLRVTNIEEELQTIVMQNWRDDTARRNLKANYINNKGLTWEHHRQLIFDAGNEYHKFEMLDVSHPTMGLESMEWDGTQWIATPFIATTRRNYLTDVDADGAFYIRNSDRTEIDYTCEYVWVDFKLQTSYEGQLYIDGLWATDANREHYRMQYDDATRTYHARIMLKQGYYSYQFVKEDGRLAESEGSFYQTENRYQALIYYKPAGQRTWQLVGYRAVELR